MQGYTSSQLSIRVHTDVCLCAASMHTWFSIYSHMATLHVGIHIIPVEHTRAHLCVFVCGEHACMDPRILTHGDVCMQGYTSSQMSVRAPGPGQLHLSFRPTVCARISIWACVEDCVCAGVCIYVCRCVCVCVCVFIQHLRTPLHHHHMHTHTRVWLRV